MPLLASVVAPSASRSSSRARAIEIGEPIGTIPRLARRWTRIGYRRQSSTRAAAGGGVTLVVDADALRPRPLRVRHRQLADPAGRDPAPHHDPAPAARCRRGRRADDRAGAGAQPRHRLPAQRRLLRGERPAGRAKPAATDGGRGRSLRHHRQGPVVPARADHLHGQPRPRRPRRSIRSSATPTGLKLWLRPVPFTQKQLRVDIDALEKRYRELGYVGVRVTHRLLDAAERRPRGEERPPRRSRSTSARRSPSRSRATTSVSSSTLRDELTLLSRGAYDDYEVGASADAIQRYYQAATATSSRASTGAASACRPTRSGSCSRSTRARELRVRGVEFVGNKSRPPASCAGVVSVRKYPPAGPRRRRLRDRQADGAGRRAHRRALPRAWDSSRRRRTPRRRRRRRRWASSAPWRRRADTVSRDANDDLRALHHRGGAAAHRSASEDFRTDDGRARSPTTSSSCSRASHLRPGDAYTPPAVRDDGRRLERLLGDAGYPTPASIPTSTATAIAST